MKWNKVQSSKVLSTIDENENENEKRIGMVVTANRDIIMGMNIMRKMVNMQGEDVSDSRGSMKKV
jgi:hypothetical protein